MWNLITLIKIPLAAFTGGYIVLIAVMSAFQSKLVYFPSKDMSVNPKYIGLEYESVTFTGNDETELFGWYIPKKDANTTLLFLHGNGGNISHRLDSIKIFNALGLNVFIFDYRGYGNSKGSANEQNTYDDAKSAWEYLIEKKGAKAENIIIFGRSLGGAVAAYIGAELDPKAVILESAFSSVKEMASDAYPFVPHVFIHFNYETKNYIKGINSPILIVHSEDDDIVPFRHGKVLFEHANEPKSFITMRGTHNRGFLQSKDIYVDGLKNFLGEINR